MKKLLFTVALCVVGTFAYAQVSAVKEAKGLMKARPDQAAKVILPALTNPETANDPNTWKLAGDIQKAIYDAENVNLYLPGRTADTTKLYNSLSQMFDYYLKCDELEDAMVKSGALKKAKLRKPNAESLKKLRINLVNGGADAYNTENYAGALKYFGQFVDVAKAPIFADDPSVVNDTLNAMYANYAALAARMLDDKDNIIKYSTIGKDDKEQGWRALSFLAEMYGDPETGDSIKWLETIKEGFERYPEQNYFVGNLMDYFIRRGELDEGMAQVNELLAKGETPYLLYVKAVLLYEKKDFAASEAVCDQIIGLGKELVAEAYAKKGDCAFFPAQLIVEENANIDVDDPKYNTNDAKIKELYEKALPSYLKAKEAAPDNKQLWGNFLLNIYWKLNKAEYEVLEKELGY